MYSTLLLLPILIPFIAASMQLPHPPPAQHLDHPLERKMHDSEHQRLAKVRATSERSDEPAQVLVRRKKRDCAATGQAVAIASTTDSRDAAVSTSTSSDVAVSTLSAAYVVTLNKNSSGSLMDMLFPVGTGTASWTTCTESTSALSCAPPSPPAWECTLTLPVTGALKPLTAGKLPPTSTSPDGQSALIANFPAGTVDPSSTSGFSFYTQGAQNSVDVTGAKEVLFSYSVFFKSGFQFQKGGKMPGLYGGTSLAMAKSCSGGRQHNRDECFSVRLMWRTNGMGELYNYYPTSVTQGSGYCSLPPYSVCDTVYGDSSECRSSSLIQERE